MDKSWLEALLSFLSLCCCCTCLVTEQQDKSKKLCNNKYIRHKYFVLTYMANLEHWSISGQVQRFSRKEFFVRCIFKRLDNLCQFFMKKKLGNEKHILQYYEGENTKSTNLMLCIIKCPLLTFVGKGWPDRPSNYIQIINGFIIKCQCCIMNSMAYVQWSGAVVCWWRTCV